MTPLSRPRLERLMRYYQFLCGPNCQLSKGQPLRTVTSAQLSRALESDPTLVRKDLATLGIIGQPRVGFSTVEICSTIRRSLGFDAACPAVLVGAGHLGGALLAYPGFHEYGLSIVAAFDKDAAKIGTSLAGCRIKPLNALEPFIRQRGIDLAILTTPAEEAQRLADRLLEAGIRAIWNFTLTKLQVSNRAFVRNEQISLGIAELTYHLSNDARTPAPSKRSSNNGSIARAKRASRIGTAHGTASICRHRTSCVRAILPLGETSQTQANSANSKVHA